VNKKAQSLEFLVTIFIAIAIFFFALAFVQKTILRLTDEGLDKFNELNLLIDEIQESEVGSIQGMRFVIDKKTAIIFFQNEPVKIGEDLINVRLGTIEEFYAEPPKLCENREDCFCLVRKIEKDEKNLAGKINVVLDKIICYDKDYKISGIDKLTRGLFKSDIEKEPILYVEKTEDSVVICTELDENKCAI